MVSQTAMRCSSNRPSRSAFRSRSNVPTPCMNVFQYANVADCILPAAVNSRCIACKVVMCFDSSCLSSRADSLYPDANACWISLTSLAMSFLLKSVWSRCCSRIRIRIRIILFWQHTTYRNSNVYKKRHNYICADMEAPTKTISGRYHRATRKIDYTDHK